MSWWDSFTGGISSIASGAGAQAKSITGGGAYLSEDEKKKEQELHNTVKNSLSFVGDQVNKLPIPGAVKGAVAEVAKNSADVLLEAATFAHEKVISPYMRGISTIGLLTDKNSPLYKKGQYEEGFQFNDIKAAYNRSAKVSMFQALTKSDLTPVKGLSSIVLSTGDIDLDEVDLWSDDSLKKNYVDNAVGRWFTGIGDMTVGTAALGGAGRVAGFIVKAGGKRAGIYTAGKTVEELAADMDTGIAYATSNGAKGTQTVSGSHTTILAESKDYGVISDIVGNYSTNGKLVNLIHDASTPEAVRDLILADKAYLPAMQRLAKTAPDELFDLSDTAALLQSKIIQTGKVDISDAGMARLKTAYDAAIKKNPQFVKIREAFLDDKYNPLHGGKAYRPMEPVIGAGAIIKGQKVIRDIKGAKRFREFDQVGEILSTKIGGRVVTELVKFSSRQTEAKPLGFVTFSGVRPLDGRIELNAFLNNIKMFNDGSKLIEYAPGVMRKVGDVRREFEETYMKALGVNETAALEQIDASIGRMLAYKAGIYDEKEIANLFSGFRTNVTTGINTLKSKGMAIGHDGRRIETEAQTIRQMEESYRFTPWDSMEARIALSTEKSLGRTIALRTQETAAQVLRDMNRVWTFDVLVRPMYIIKQSFAEPVISATIAQGMDVIWKDLPNITANGFRNLNNKVQYGIRKAYDKKKWNSVNKAVEHNQLAYRQAVAIKETLQVEYEGLLAGGASPMVKKTHLAAARKELEAADRLLDKYELSLRAYMVPIGVKEAIPSLTTLERRIAFLEAKTGKKRSAELAKAKNAVAAYKRVISQMATNKKVIVNADKALATAYDDIDNVLNTLKPALKEQADVWGKPAAFKKRYYGREKQTHVLDNGESVEIDSFVANDKNFGAAMRAETSNARTADMTALGEYSVGTRQAILRRKVPGGPVSVNNPTYFEELAHIANRIIRQDPLMDQILAGKSIRELTKWSKTEQGIRYLEHFDIYEAKQVPAYLADKVSLVERTFPSLEARATILEREVTAQELQGLLAQNADELYDIVPTNFAYGMVDNAAGMGKYEAVSSVVNNTAASLYRWMAAAENPVRNAFFEREANAAVVRKANDLLAQGIKITPEKLNALRQSAGREAIETLEKTVYTVRRENRLLGNLRMVTAFPTATVNAFIRYGRLAVTQPVRTAGFMYNYGRAFQNFGVDENGNPTDDINEITHLIVPGTNELNLGYMDEGVALNAKSIGFLLNQPSPSYITSLSVGKIMKWFPGTEDDIREIMDSTGVFAFDTVFPYGPPTSVTKVFTPPWANGLWNAATGPEGKQDYLSSWNSVYNYHKMLVEMGIEKKFPSDERIRSEVRALWRDKFLSGFVSLAGVPYKVETNPMRLSTNLYYKLLEKYNKQGLPPQQARDAAGDEMLATMGTGFMIDRITSTASGSNMNIPATYESYQRVFEDNDNLVAQLAAIDSDSINIVSLLTADLSRDPSERSDNITKILTDPKLTLPGTSKRISDFKMTPQEAEAERIKNRTWQKYSLIKEALEAKITDGKTLRAHPELKSVLDNLAATTLKGESQQWWDEFQMSASGDSSYKYARAFSLITNDKKFMDANGKNDFWHDVSYFMKARNMAVAVYQALPDNDTRKADLKDMYNAWVSANVEQWDPNLKTIIEQNFDNDTLKAVM